MTSTPPPPQQPQYGQPQQPQLQQYGQPQQQVMPVCGPQAAMMQPPAGHGALMLTLQGNALTTGLKPTVRIDGYPVPAAFGANFYPLRPGQHRVDVHAQWMRQYGQAAMGLDIREGQTIPGFYAVPWHQFTTGSIGYQTQSRKGLGVMLAIIGVPTVIILAMCLLALLVN